MSNWINGFTVILEEPMREEEANALALAINKLRNVSRVTPYRADMGADYFSEQRLLTSLQHKFNALISEMRK